MDRPKILDEIDIIVNDRIFKFKEIKKLNLKDDPVDINMWNLMSKLFNSNKLENKNGKEEIKFNILKEKIKKDLELNEIKIKVWCDNNLINYELIQQFLIRLGQIVSNYLTIEKNIDSDFEEESPVQWVNKINLYKFLKTNNIKEKIIKSFILGKSLNYGIKLDFNKEYYNSWSINKNLYIQKNIFPQLSFSHIIFYYNSISSPNDDKTYLNFVNDIELDYYTTCLPHIFNKNIFKKIRPFIKREFNKNNLIINKTIHETNGSNYDQIVYFLNNNSIGQSPWENEDMPSLSDYLKKLRK